MKKGNVIGGIATALIGSGLLWYGGSGHDNSIAGWETLNTRMEQAIGTDEHNRLKDDSSVEKAATAATATAATAETAHAQAAISPSQASPELEIKAGPVESNASPAPVAVADGMVNVNTAAAAGLMDLPGIGAKKAQEIIDYRDSHGPFKNLFELGNVKGIGPKMLEKLKPKVLF
ncbi:ComEA family DNA-binding protein [Paenibacillus sp. BR2-3]|uniref:ComEA family DNA-binding protein n=1 Tax=Paenibacillus sp. BR2-3 TaxID=3048494 RepID=UPI003977C695